MLEVNLRKSQIPHLQNKHKIVYLLGHDVERVQCWCLENAQNVSRHIGNPSYKLAIVLSTIAKGLSKGPTWLTNPGCVVLQSSGYPTYPQRLLQLMGLHVGRPAESTSKGLTTKVPEVFYLCMCWRHIIERLFFKIRKLPVTPFRKMTLSCACVPPTPLPRLQMHGIHVAPCLDHSFQLSLLTVVWESLTWPFMTHAWLISVCCMLKPICFLSQKGSLSGA